MFDDYSFSFPFCGQIFFSHKNNVNHLLLLDAYIREFDGGSYHIKYEQCRNTSES